MARILLYDLETSMLEGRCWRKYDDSLNDITRYSEILTISWKHYGDDSVHGLARKDYKKVDGDRSLCLALSDLMADVDMIVGHNISGFDAPVANARFLTHGLPGVPNVAVVDTLQIARKYFKFPGNSLDDLAKYLGIGSKKKTGGKDLWIRCMNSDPKAFKEMLDYNKQDVVLLEKVFKKLVKYAKNIPNLNLLDPKKVHGENCPNPTCGSKNVQQRGYGATAKGRHRRMQCQDCLGWFTAKVQVVPGPLKVVRGGKAA